MKKKLNIFCVLMLLLMVAEVVMSLITGADDFQEGFNEASKNAELGTTWGEQLEFFAAMFTVLAVVVSFISFVRFILNVNRNKVFVWENVKLLRLTAFGLLIFAIATTCNELHTGCSLVEVYDHCFDEFLFGVFNLIVSEVFAIGLKLQKEQELTI